MRENREVHIYSQKNVNNCEFMKISHYFMSSHKYVNYYD